MCVKREAFAVGTPPVETVSNLHLWCDVEVIAGVGFTRFERARLRMLD
jgi:hypothetical protein